MNADVGTCKGCGKSILWIKNENGKAEPFDGRAARVLHEVGHIPPKDRADFTIIKGHLPHFVTCPNADRFRKGGKKS